MSKQVQVGSTAAVQGCGVSSLPEFLRVGKSFTELLWVRLKSTLTLFKDE